MTKFFNDNNPAVKQKMEINEMSVEVEQLKQVIKMLAEEGDKGFNSLNNMQEDIQTQVDSLNGRLKELAITQQKTTKVCGIMLVVSVAALITSAVSIIL